MNLLHQYEKLYHSLLISSTHHHRSISATILHVISIVESDLMEGALHQVCNMEALC